MDDAATAARRRGSAAGRRRADRPRRLRRRGDRAVRRCDGGGRPTGAGGGPDGPDAGVGRGRASGRPSTARRASALPALHGVRRPVAGARRADPPSNASRTSGVASSPVTHVEAFVRRQLWIDPAGPKEARFQAALDELAIPDGDGWTIRGRGPVDIGIVSLDRLVIEELAPDGRPMIHPPDRAAWRAGWPRTTRARPASGS